MQNLTKNETKVLKALRGSVEAEYWLVSGNLPQTWVQVYLDNAIARLEKTSQMSRKTFAGVLGSLEKKGFYTSQGDNRFGDVLIVR